MAERQSLKSPRELVPVPENFASSKIEASLVTAQASAQIVRFELAGATDRIFRREGHYWLDMCLSPRPERARGCYRDRWGPHRFERLGDIILLPPGEMLHIRTDGSGTQFSIVCEIAKEAIDLWLDGGIEWNDRRLEASLDLSHAHIRHCLFRLAEEARHSGPGRMEMARLLADQLAIEVARYCLAIADKPIAGGLASWRLRIIDERLDRSGPPPTLQELADLCALSVRQLTRGFRSSRGLTIGDHISQSRIERAKRHLSGEESLKSIAFGLGFASPSSFSFSFRRATGISPRLFRQRQLRKRG